MNKTIVVTIVFLAVISLVLAAPSGPTVTLIKNETATPDTAAIINTTGGSITTLTLNVTSQNYKWKAYVGNVSGTLVLADAQAYSLFDWTLTFVSGEVYATRTSAPINWTNINCSNTTHMYNENIALNHTGNPDDNITSTFDTSTHNEFYVGTRRVHQNTCFAIHTNVNNVSQSTSFEEVVLYDGSNATNGDIVFATTLEQNVLGYNNQSYDFQMIVPERGLAGWSSSTAYYFYAELS
jgi:hypothetical protein